MKLLKKIYQITIKKMNKRELKTQITLLKKRMQKMRKYNTNVKELYFKTRSIE